MNFTSRNASRIIVGSSIAITSAWPQVDGDSPPELPIGDIDDSGEPVGGNPEADSQVELPWVGTVDVTKLGLPVFTILVGLIDGFNPCAMWVLLFLLSILVNLQDRARILAVAGTFVVVSGIAYFAFMAAWLNVFLFLGYLRPVEIALGILAVVVGTIHIKDFFAFKKGVSLSIPESAKPGIYQRVRGIVTAQNITGAILGAIVLAVMVNIVELLCTAGLPALYTHVLTSHGLPTWKNYAYLFLYNLAYMFDDSLMVLAVTWTLGKRKLQEHEGQWLKLISGLVILGLGLVMIFSPTLLH
ncbi:MAG: hypothetical protein MUF23_05970 [Pirellula sp.]|nr:hypothetical protein [Pirellula sp.]